MFSRFGKKKNPQENTPINPNIQGVLNNAMRINHQAHQTTIVDPATSQDQTQENLIVARPSTFAPIQVSSDPSTSISPANHEQQQVTSGQADLPQRVGCRSWISSSVSIGQDHAFNEVCKFLTENDVAIVGIYGMGGVGKTTLMKKVQNEFLEPSNFKVISTVVSRTVNIDKIHEDLMRELDLPFERDANRCKRAKDISKKIAECWGKLALLFDDIWEVLDLDEIANLGAIDLNTTIFKVIFTTRMEYVCSQMQPHREIKIQPLGWADSWALFAKNVGSKTLHSNNNEILDLAESVAKECGGLPLALVVIGRSMTCQYSRGAWENALFTLQMSPSRFSRSEEKLFSILKFSYDNIHNDVEKECFLFCCLYPEDWEINRHELVEFWIGDGILDLDDSYHETCNRGDAIVDRLLAACLLELKDYNLTMHDIVRDMGLWIASELRFFVHGRRLKLNKGQIMSRWKEAHGVYVLQGDGLPERPYCQNLSTLILNNKLEHRIFILPCSLFQFMDKLRILKLVGNVGFSDKSYGMLGQLAELRHLSLLDTSVRRFPSELGKLRKLIVLEIRFPRNTVSLPPAMWQLIELRRLLITGSVIRIVLPPELGMLSRLEELRFEESLISHIPEGVFEGMAELRTLMLSVTSVSILPADLWNLTKLEHLRIKSLSIRDSNILPWLKAGNVGKMKMEKWPVFKSLRVVELQGWPIFEWNDIRSALEAMTQMSELSIFGFPIHEIIFATSKSFSKLKKLYIELCRQLEKLQVGGHALNGLFSLTIISCASLKHIIGLEHLQCLKHLTIEECPELEGEIMKPNEGIGPPPIICFPCLQTIRLKYLRQVTIICNDNVSFPSLLDLYINECCKLEKFPRGFMNEERPLLSFRGMIIGKTKWWEGMKWQDEDFKSYLLPFFIPAYS